MSGGIASADAWLDPLRTEDVCFDTMIIRHLVQAGAGEALVAAFGGRMYWPEAVDTELRLQSTHLKALASFLSTSPATVIELTDEEDSEASDIRLDLVTRRQLKIEPTTNLGEAQCVVVCRRPGETYAFVCNDGKAREWARTHGLKPWSVIDVLYVFVREGIKRPGPAWELYVRAVDVTKMYELPAFPVASGRATFLRQAEGLRAAFLAERESAGRASDIPDEDDQADH